MALDTIYVTRHGFRSSWNVNPLTGEYSANIPSPTGIAVDPALTAHGVQQAKELGHHLLHGVRPPIERVYSSPFYRCMQTIEPFVRSALQADDDASSPAKPYGQLLRIRAEPGLGEWFGSAPFEHPAPAPPQVLAALFPGILDEGYSPAVVPTSRGESTDELHDRVALAALRVIERCDAEGVRSVVLCSHAAVVIALGRVLTGHMPSDIHAADDFHAYTCGLSVYRRRRPSGPGEDQRSDHSSRRHQSNHPAASEAAGPAPWRDGVGVGGGWTCELDSDCSFLSSGCERGWKFSGEESFGGIDQSNVDGADKRTTRL